MLLAIPALIDATNAAMPARRNINAFSSGPVVGDKPASSKTGEPLDVASPVRRCQGVGSEDAEALHGRRPCVRSAR